MWLAVCIAEDGARGAYLAALDGRAVPADARTAMTAAARDALHATTLADQDAANRAFSAAWDATETAITRADEDAALRALDAAGDATNTAQAAYDTAWAAAMTALMAGLEPDMSKTTTPFTFTVDELAAGSPYVPATAKSYICDGCDAITFNQPEDGDVLCDLCSPDAYHAHIAALQAAVDDAAADVYEVRVYGVPGYPGYDEELAEVLRDLADAQAALLAAA